MNFLNSSSKRLWLASSVFALVACASIQQVAYTPQPDRVADPREEIARFIKLNTVSGCLAEPVFEDRVLDVKFVCSNGIGHNLARLDRVKSISIEQYKEWYRVVLKHSEGIDDFAWSSKSLEDVQRAADAFHVLVHGVPEESTDGSRHSI